MKTKLFIVTIVIGSTLYSCNKWNKSETKTFSKNTVETQHTGNDTATYSQPNTGYIQENHPTQLLNKHELTEKDLYLDYDGKEEIARYFTIELIDKQTFDNNKSIAIQTISIDTADIHKIDGTIRIPCKNGEISFKDNLSDNINHREYSYIGDIPALNAYLFSSTFWEGWEFFLVDKTFGKTIQSFANEPYLSNDLKYIVCLDFDSYEGTTLLSLYQINDTQQIDEITSIYVKKWIPINTFDKMYWANDSYLYVPILHSADFWAAEGSYTELDQYIRLKPTA